MYSTQIQDHMVRFPYVTLPDQAISDAMEYMKDLGVRHLPVVGDGKLSGIVSERDLKAALNLEHANHLTVGDVMQREIYMVRRHTPLAEVAEEMAIGKVGSAVIVDDSGNVSGIFTTTDALRLLANRLEEETFADISSFEDYEHDLGITNERNY